MPDTIAEIKERLAHAPIDIAALLELLDSLRKHLPAAIGALRDSERIYSYIADIEELQYAKKCAEARRDLEAIRERLARPEPRRLRDEALDRAAQRYHKLKGHADAMADWLDGSAAEVCPVYAYREEFPEELEAL